MDLLLITQYLLSQSSVVQPTSLYTTGIEVTHNVDLQTVCLNNPASLTRNSSKQ